MPTFGRNACATGTHLLAFRFFRKPYCGPGLDAAFDLFTQLTDADLTVKLEPSTEEEMEDADMRSLADMLRGYNIEILNEDGDLNAQTMILLNLCTAALTIGFVSVAWGLGDNLGAFAGESLKSLTNPDPFLGISI